MLALLLVSTAAQATDWSVVFNGRSVHLDATEDWNESNWGLGFEREFDGDSRWVKVALGGGFRDSQDEMSYMAGGGVKRRFRPRARELYVDVGLIAFAMTRRDVNRNEPFPGVLPALTIGSRQLAVNLTYMPASVSDRITNGRRIDPELDGILFLQLKLDAALFAPRRTGQRR